jgi:hypothetical protein
MFMPISSTPPSGITERTLSMIENRGQGAQGSRIKNRIQGFEGPRVQVKLTDRGPGSEEPRAQVDKDAHKSN